MNDFHVYFANIVDGLWSDFWCVAADDLPLSVPRISKLTHGPIMASDWLFIAMAFPWWTNNLVERDHDLINGWTTLCPEFELLKPDKARLLDKLLSTRWSFVWARTDMLLKTLRCPAHQIPDRNKTSRTMPHKWPRRTLIFLPARCYEPHRCPSTDILRASWVCVSNLATSLAATLCAATSAELLAEGTH